MIESINIFSQKWVELFGLVVIQNSIFIGLTFLVLWIFRKGHASLKYNVLLIALVKLFIPPFMPVYFSFLQPNSASVQTAVPVMNMPIAVQNVQTNIPAPVTLDFLSILFITWCSMIIFMLLMLTVNTFVLKRNINRNLDKLDSSNLPHGISVYKSSYVNSPMIVGILPKNIFVPGNWSDLKSETRESLLQHEVAHIVRYDGLVKIVELIAIGMNFFNPLVWLLIRRLDHYREIACDEYAIRKNNTSPEKFSRYLVQAAESLAPQEWRLGSASALAMRKKQLFYRVKYHVKERPMKYAKKLIIPVCLLLIIAVIPLSLYSGNNPPEETSPVYGKIYGTVLDAETQKPLMGVNVIVNGTPLGAATDMGGKFFVLNVPLKAYKVRFSRIGYKDLIYEVTINEENRSGKIDAVLKPTSLQMGLVTVTPDKPGKMELSQEVQRAKQLKQVQIENQKLKRRQLKLQEENPKVQQDKEYQKLQKMEKVTEYKELRLRKDIRAQKELQAQLERESKVKFIPYDSPPGIITADELAYPRKAKKNGLEGVVVLQLKVSLNGTSEDIKVLKGVSPLLDKAAIEFIKTARWKPAKQRETPVEVWTSVPIEFKL